ncbi:MAG: DUF6531 domain-containing protein [Pseudomonadota bacterium]
MTSDNYSKKYIILSYFATVFIVLLFSSTTWVYADDKDVDPGQITFRNPISEIQNEKIDPFTGELSLTYTDLTLPGNGGLDLSIIRTYKSNRELSYIPPLGPRWEIHMGRIKIIGNYVTIELQDGTINTAVRVNSSNYSYCTKDFWKIDSSNGKVLQLPDGTKIEFNHTNGAWWYATRISKNGNQIAITYQANSQNILNITDTLGRQINFTYNSIASRLRLTSIYCANDQTIQIQYKYSDNGGNPVVLNQVVFPGNEVWGYSYNNYRLSSVSTPYGGAIAYTYDYSYRAADGLSVRPQYSVISKTVSGAGTWIYAYNHDNEREITTITDPCNRVTTYRFFGYYAIGYGTCYIYGLQDEMEILNTANNTLEYKEKNTWGKINAEISSLPYSVYSLYDNKTYVPVLLNQTITTLGGDTYTTQYSNYDNFGNPRTQTETGSATKTTTLSRISQQPYTS